MTGLNNSKRIKKIILGTLISDGYCKDGRYDHYCKYEEYIKYIAMVCDNITKVKYTCYTKVDKRFNPPAKGYRILTKKHVYFQKLSDVFYDNTGKKRLTKYIVDRLDEESFAHIWMCDGYLEHAKNRNTDTVQNVGWFCLESYSIPELNLIREKLLNTYGIKSTLSRRVCRGKSYYRIRLGGEDLQKFISLVYPYILDCFKYKTILYYKDKKSKYVYNLPNAEHYIYEYKCIEDIVQTQKLCRNSL